MRRRPALVQSAYVTAVARPLVRSAVRGTSTVAARLRPDALVRPPWERSVLDDIAARRPWNLRVKWARALARRRLSRLEDGVTVIIVTWNTRDITADVVSRVRELSPRETRVLVVDNGSTDGTRRMLEAWPGIDSLLLRSNAGHGIALDLALCATTTTVAVTLDSDAIPLREDWLSQVVDPIRSGGVVLAGLRSSRDFVHPVFSAVDTATFVRQSLSYQAFVPPGVGGARADWGVEAWDTGELLTRRLPSELVAFVDPTPNLVDGLPGMTTGGVVYHHGGVSRGVNGKPTDQVTAAWRDAIGRLRNAAAADGLRRQHYG